MGRNRFLKPDIHTDARLASLADGTWRTMIGILSLVDDEGRHPATPSCIAGALYWASERPAERVRKDLEILAEKNLIALYQVDGIPYLEILGFRDTTKIFGQVINRPSPGRYPAPRGDTKSATFGDAADLTSKLAETPTSANLDINNLAVVAVAAINAMAGTAYRADSEQTLKLCRALVKAKITPTQVVAAVEHVGKPWIGHPTFASKIRPATLLQLKRVQEAIEDIAAKPAPVSPPSPEETIRFDDGSEVSDVA